MKSNNFKHVYALVLLGLTFVWAIICVWITWKAVQLPTSAGVLGAAGVDTLLGALISWNALIIQHYYRKAVPEDTTTPVPPVPTPPDDKTNTITLPLRPVTPK